MSNGVYNQYRSRKQLVAWMHGRNWKQPSFARRYLFIISSNFIVLELVALDSFFVTLHSREGALVIVVELILCRSVILHVVKLHTHMYVASERHFCFQLVRHGTIIKPLRETISAGELIFRGSTTTSRMMRSNNFPVSLCY